MVLLHSKKVGTAFEDGKKRCAFGLSRLLSLPLGLSVVALKNRMPGKSFSFRAVLPPAVPYQDPALIPSEALVRAIDAAASCSTPLKARIASTVSGITIA